MGARYRISRHQRSDVNGIRFRMYEGNLKRFAALHGKDIKEKNTIDEEPKCAHCK